MRLLLLAFSLALSLGAGELQDAIDSAKAGDIIELAAGEYHGNILIDKPLTIDGLNRSAVIIGDRNGTVIRVRSPHITIKNLTIQNGGFEHLSEDAGSCETLLTCPDTILPWTLKNPSVGMVKATVIISSAKIA